MKIAVGILGIFGGIFGFITSLWWFFLGSVASMWGGAALFLIGGAEVFLSVACLVLSVVCISAKSSNPGVALLVLAVLGVILGIVVGAFWLPISMAVCAIAGALAIYAHKQEA